MGDAVRVEQPAARLNGGIQSLIGPLSGLGPLFALILACAYFTTQTDRFLTGPNLSLVVQQSMVVGVLAIGQTLIILTAGIDLSCGAVMALGSIGTSKASFSTRFALHFDAEVINCNHAVRKCNYNATDRRKAPV